MGTAQVKVDIPERWGAWFGVKSDPLAVAVAVSSARPSAGVSGTESTPAEVAESALEPAYHRQRIMSCHIIIHHPLRSFSVRRPFTFWAWLGFFCSSFS